MIGGAGILVSIDLYAEKLPLVHPALLTVLIKQKVMINPNELLARPASNL
jgi:hypothetical protein